MKSKLNVLVLVDEVTIKRQDPEFKTGEGGKLAEYYVCNALRALRHTVSVVGLYDSIEPLLTTVKENKPDIIFNLMEQFRNLRALDQNIAGLLELLDIPFTGSGSAGLLLCRDKGLCKQLLSTRKIRVPMFVVIPPGNGVRIPRHLKYPLVVKPLSTDGSEGISNASLVRSEEELRERAKQMHERFHQPAIAEEYVEGREIYIGIVGNKRLKVLPPVELRFGNSENGGPVLATYRVKWDKEYQDKWGIRFESGELSPKDMEAVSRVSRKVFRLLQLQDYARIDLRLTPEGKVVVLEANPNPDIADHEEIAMGAKKAGLDYTDLIDLILRLALRRHRKGAHD